MKKALVLLALSLTSLPLLAADFQRLNIAGYRIGDSEIMGNDDHRIVATNNAPEIKYDEIGVTDNRNMLNAYFNVSIPAGQEVVKWIAYNSNPTNTIPAQTNKIAGAVTELVWSYNPSDTSAKFIVVDYDYITYTLKYNDGSGSTSSKKHVYTNNFNLASNQFSKTGYSFNGWTNETGMVFADGVLVSGESFGVTYTNTTANLYAQWTPNAYTVTLDPCDGSVDPGSVDVTYDAAWPALPTPTRDGHRFVGWFTEASGGTEINTNSTYATAANSTNYAHWVELVTATFKDGYTDEVLKTETLDKGGTPTPPEAPEHSGYYPKGWTPAVSAISVNTTFTMEYAQYSYTVVFHADNGTGAEQTQQFTYNAPAEPLNSVASMGFLITGYNFQNWTNSTGTVYFNGQEVSNLAQSGEYHLYAVWTLTTYTIAFDGNGADNPDAMVEDTMTLEGAETKPLVPNKFEKTGYTFAGWATNETTAVAYTNCADVVSTDLWLGIGETNVFYAVWQTNTYTVVFNANGYTGSMDDQVFYYDQVQALPGCAFYSTLDFRGWATNQEGGVVFDDHATVSNLTAEANGIVMLYAVWSNGKLSDAMHCTNIVWKTSGDGADWRIAEGKNEGYSPSGSSVSNMVFWTLDGDCLTSKKLTFKPSAHGTLSFWYKFSAGDQDNNERWLTINTDPESTLYGGTTWTNCTLSMGSDKNVEIFFEMDPNANAYDYTVWIDQMTWVPDGSEEPEDSEAIKLSLQNAIVNGEEADETYASSEGGTSVKRNHASPRVSFTADPAPVDGVLFDSWELTIGEESYSTNSNPLVLDGNATCFSETTESNCYVRAKYKWLEYSINYDDNGGHGTVTPDASSYIYTNKVALASASPSAGYSFAGWTTNAAEGAVFGPGQVVTGADIGATTSEVVTLYANWTQNVYSVTFDANGGSFDGESAKSVTFNDVYGDLPTPSRAGHVFAGWTHDGEPVYSNTVVATASDHAIVAEWTANQYVVVFNANGGAGTMENQQFVYGEEQALSAVGFTAEERRFTGWSLTQDGAVAYGDRSVVSNLTEVAGGTVTLFASWESSGEGGEDDGPMLVGTGKVTVPKTWKTGQKVTWKATADKGSVFAHWEGPLVESLNLTANELRNPSLAFAVPEGFETNQVNAVFIPVDEDGLSALAVTQTEFEPKEAVSNVWLTDDSQSYVTASASGLPAGLRFDAKTLRITGAPSKSGVYWVQIKAKNASGYQWAENFKVTVSGGGTEAKEPKLVRTAYHPLTVICATEGGTATGTGVYAEGKKASVKATAAKNYVFAGWYEDSELSVPAAFDVGDWRATSQNVIIPDMRYIYACFAEKSEDVQSLKVIVTNGVTEADGTYSQDLGASIKSLSLPKLAVSGLPSGLKYDAKTLKISGKASKPGIYTVTVKATNSSVTKATEATTATFEITVPNFECAALPRLKPATDAYGTNSVGVAFDPAHVDCTPTDGWTVKAAGLPAGLKWDTKSGTIAGVPTAKTGAYTVTFTASKKGEENQVATITLNVEALPEWAVGTFDGSVDGGGLVQSFTVSANGKISGKVLKDGLVWTLSAPSFSDVEIPGSEAESPVFHASVIGKSGKLAFTNEVAVSAEAFGESMRGVAEGEEWSAWQNLWKTEPWKTAAKPFANKSLVMSGTADGLPNDGDSVTLKFAASGTVSASGKFVTGFNEKTKNDIVYSASCSSVLIPAGEGHYSVFVYFPLKAGKFDGYAAEVQLVWTGAAFEKAE